MEKGKEIRVVKELSIRRLEVEKFCMAMKQIFEPLELGKRLRS